MFGTSSKNLKEPSSRTKGFADVARRLSTSLTAFGFKSQSNTPTQTPTSLPRQSATSTAMTMMEETTEERPQIPAVEEETEDIRERSVKVTFPKKQTMTGPITEEKIRIAASSFGMVVDVGMKEKLAVVLFAKSSDAFNFSCHHNGMLGEDFKVKFMGQSAQATTNTSIDHATTTTMSPKEMSTTSSPMKAEKAAAAAIAAAIMADQAAAISSAVINQPAEAAVTLVDADAEDMDDAAGFSFQGITGDKHRDSKILLMNMTTATTAKGNDGAFDDVEVVVPEPSPPNSWKQAARPSMSASVTLVASSRDNGTDRPVQGRSQWSSQDSASPSSSLDDKKEKGHQSHGHDVDDDDDDDSAFSIDMNDLKRDLGMEVKPEVDNDGTHPVVSSLPSPVSNMAPSSLRLEHDLRSPSPIEVTVQRLSVVKLTPTQLNTSNKEKEKTNDALADKATQSTSKGIVERGLSVSSKSQPPEANEKDTDQVPSLPPPRTMTLSPKTTKQRSVLSTATVVSIDEQPKNEVSDSMEQDKGSRLDRASQGTGSDDVSQQTAVVREPLLSASVASAASTASAAAWIVISNSMEEELRALRKKVVLLEAEAKVRHRERDDFDREVRSSEQHWAIELAALAQHNAKLETENIRLKDAVQQMTVTTARKDAQLAALGESVTYYQVEMHRHQQQLEVQLQADEDSRALPLYPRFLFKQQQPPDHSSDAKKKSSSSSPPLSKHAAAMVVRNPDEDTDLHHWKSPSSSAFADETKSSDMPPHPLPPSTVAGSSATTCSLFDDLVATRRQLDDLSRLSNIQFPGHHHSDVHLSSTIKQTKDHGRTAVSQLVGSTLRSTSVTDISALTAIARGDFFHNNSSSSDQHKESRFANTSGSNGYHRHTSEKEIKDTKKGGFDASSFNETMDRIVQMGNVSSSYHQHLLKTSTSNSKQPSSSSLVTSDQWAAIYKPLQLPAFSLATPSKSKSSSHYNNNKEFLRHSTGSISNQPTMVPSGTMSYYSQYAPSSSHKIPT